MSRVERLPRSNKVWNAKVSTLFGLEVQDATVTSIYDEVVPVLVSSSPWFRGFVRRSDNPIPIPHSLKEPGVIEEQRRLGSGKELSRVVTSVGLKV